MGNLGKSLIGAGAVLMIIGSFLAMGGKVPNLGRLPGDMVWRKGTTTVYFPLTTSLIVSLALSMIGWIVSRR